MKPLICLLILFVPFYVSAETAHIVIDADSGSVLLEENADAPWYPASLTKLMTLYLVFSDLEADAVKMSTSLKASSYAVKQSPKKLGMSVGEKITVKDAIKALSTVSSNDVAMVLAEGLEGSENKFVARMNRTAVLLGMKDTFFKNPNGLPSKGQVTSARDMAILAKRLLHDFPDYYHFFSNYKIIYDGVTHLSHNSFVQNYPGADGLKTGYTCGSGYNLVASAKRKGTRLITVILGAESSGKRKAIATRLMDAGFKKGVDAPGLPLLFFRRSVPLALQAPQVIEGGGCITL